MIYTGAIQLTSRSGASQANSGSSTRWSTYVEGFTSRRPSRLGISTLRIPEYQRFDLRLVLTDEFYLVVRPNRFNVLRET